MLTPLHHLVFCLLGGGLGGEQFAPTIPYAPAHPILIEAEPCPFELPTLIADSDDLDEEDDADDALLRLARAPFGLLAPCIALVPVHANDTSSEPAPSPTRAARLRALHRLLI